jgi:hypothetical protein
MKSTFTYFHGLLLRYKYVTSDISTYPNSLSSNSQIFIMYARQTSPACHTITLAAQKKTSKANMSIAYITEQKIENQETKTSDA